MTKINNINWDRLIPNISMKALALETITFNNFAINKGTTFEGTFIGTTDEDGTFRYVFYVPALQKRVAIEPELIQVDLLNIRQCFRCGKYADLAEFKRPVQLRDKSPILSQVCSNCYRRAHNQVTSRRSQANKIGAKNTLTIAEWLEKLLASEGHCFYCKKHTGYADLIIEHMTPISWGGGHAKENIVPACISCNSSKGDRDIETWQRRLEAKQLLELLQDHLQLSKFEVTNLAIKQLAIHEGLINEDSTEAAS